MRNAAVLVALSTLASLVILAPPAAADLPDCPVDVGRNQMWGAAVCVDRDAATRRVYYETWGEFHYDRVCLV